MVDNAKIKARKVFEKTYCDIATIKVYQKKVVNGLTKTELTILHKDIPCRLCFNSGYSKIDQVVYGAFENQIILMLSPDIEVPKNSVISVVRKNGESKDYSHSNSMTLITHQAVFLVEKDTKS